MMEKEIEDFDRDCLNDLEQIVKNQAFYREALSRGIDIPYNASEDATSYILYTNVAQYKNEQDPETGAYPLDVEETQKQFARVIRWAREKGWSVEKSYTDDEFRITVKGEGIPTTRAEFYSTRQVVCKRVQTGTKVVPAREEPQYEYLCDKVAFLKVEV